LAEQFTFFGAEPVEVGPLSSNAVDLEVTLWLIKVLNVDWPSVVVAQTWEDRDGGVGPKSSFQILSQELVIISNFLIRVAPDVVCRIVTSPSDEVSLELILVLGKVLEHVLDCPSWCIAAILSPLASGSGTSQYFHSWAVVSAANWEVALCGCSNLVMDIYMEV
jgi:hypothetical protein